MEKANGTRSGYALIGQLVAFEATARLGSFRAAADELHITTGAVAQQIRLMEQKLGLEVFQRLPRGTRLRAEAEPFLSKIQLALGLINDATRELSAAGTAAGSRALTLSTTAAFASRWLIPKLARLSETEPTVSIMIDASDTRRSLHGTSSVDMAIRWGTPPFNGCYAHLLHAGRAIPVCAPSVKKIHRLKAPCDLAAGAPLIADSHDNWQRWFVACGCSPTTAAYQTFSQTSLAIEAAERGLGVALVPEVLVAAALTTGGLVRALDKKHSLETDAGFYLVTGSEPEPGSDLGKVLTWLLREAALSM